MGEKVRGMKIDGDTKSQNPSVMALRIRFLSIGMTLVPFPASAATLPVERRRNATRDPGSGRCCSAVLPLLPGAADGRGIRAGGRCDGSCGRPLGEGAGASDPRPVGGDPLPLECAA